MTYLRLDQHGFRIVNESEVTNCKYRLCVPDFGPPYAPDRQPSFCCRCGDNVIFNPLQGPTHTMLVCWNCVARAMADAYK